MLDSYSFSGHQLELKGVEAFRFLAESGAGNWLPVDLLAADGTYTPALVHVEGRV